MISNKNWKEISDFYFIWFCSNCVGYPTSDVKIIMNGQNVKIWKGVTVAYFKILSCD
jgi:hypothetical protein